MTLDGRQRPRYTSALETGCRRAAYDERLDLAHSSSGATSSHRTGSPLTLAPGAAMEQPWSPTDAACVPVALGVALGVAVRVGVAVLVGSVVGLTVGVTVGLGVGVRVPVGEAVGRNVGVRVTVGGTTENVGVAVGVDVASVSLTTFSIATP